MANDALEVKNSTVVSDVEEADSVGARKNRRGLSRLWPKLISLVFAVILWLGVMEVNPPNVYKTYDDVPVKIMNVTDAKITGVDGAELSVDVTVMAKKNQISSLTKQSITLIVDASNIQESGTYSLEIMCVLPSGYKMHKLSSETITVVVDMGTEKP